MILIYIYWLKFVSWRNSGISSSPKCRGDYIHLETTYRNHIQHQTTIIPIITQDNVVTLLTVWKVASCKCITKPGKPGGHDVRLHFSLLNRTGVERVRCFLNHLFRVNVALLSFPSKHRVHVHSSGSVSLSSLCSQKTKPTSCHARISMTHFIQLY